MLDQHLIVFLAVAKRKNFSRAAEDLSMSQPGVSQHISALEEYYGAKLFDRTNKRVELTRAGETLLPFAEKIVEFHSRSRQAIADLVGKVSGKISIGTSYTIGEYILPRILAEYTQQFPDVEISVMIDNTNRIVTELEEYKLDIGLVEGTVTSNDLQIESFFKDELCVILPPEHALSGKAVLSIKDILDETWILREPGSGTRAVADKLFLQAGRMPVKRMILGSTQAIKESIVAGLGVSLLSQWVVDRDVAYGVLNASKLSDFDATRMLSIVLPKSQFHTRAVHEFRELAMRLFNREG